MAVTNVTPVQLVLNTPSDDILDANGTAAATPADGWSITLGANGWSGGLLLKFLADGTGDTVTILAGDNPPSKLAPQGSLAVVLAPNDVRYLYLEPGRFLHDDTTIKATCVDGGTTVIAFLLPKGIGGGTAIA